MLTQKRAQPEVRKDSLNSQLIELSTEFNTAKLLLLLSLILLGKWVV